MSNATAPPPNPADALPPYLNLPPHLSAHKYFFVCTLTVAAWDTLVLSPRTWKLFRSPEWPPLKIAFYFLRIVMPIEFIAVAVAFFDNHWTTEMCQSFFLFEPIVTAVLVTVCSLVHLVRVRAIYSLNSTVTGFLSLLLILQASLMGVSCGFYEVVPVDDPSQGCIAGPKHVWVGVYWVGATLFFSSTFGLAISRSLQSREQKPIGLWKLMLRDGLNLYGAIWLVNMVNMLFWFLVTPTGPSDTIRTVVTSMTAVLTTTMTMRIILSVRGSLVAGGSFAGSTTAPTSSGATHSVGNSQGVRSGQARSGGGATGPVFSINPASAARPTYTFDEMNGKEGDWHDDAKGSFNGGNGLDGKHEQVTYARAPERNPGVKVTIERDFE